MFHFTTVHFSILQRAFFRKLEYNPSLRNSPGSNNRKVRLSSCDILQSLTVLSLLNCCIKAESTLFRKELKKSPQNDRAHPFVFPLTFFLPLHKATWSGRMVSPPSASPVGEHGLEKEGRTCLSGTRPSLVYHSFREFEVGMQPDKQLLTGGRDMFISALLSDSPSSIASKLNERACMCLTG